MHYPISEMESWVSGRKKEGRREGKESAHHKRHPYKIFPRRHLHMEENPSTNYIPGNLSTPLEREPIATEPSGEQEKILCVFLLLHINPVVSQLYKCQLHANSWRFCFIHTFQSCEPSQQKNLSFFSISYKKQRATDCCPWKPDTLTGSPAQSVLVLQPSEITYPFNLIPYQ